MSDFNDLLLKHRGKVFAIIGGAPFDAELMADVKADVWISVNEHGIKLRDCDYVVAMDDNHTGLGVGMVEHLHSLSDTPVIGPQGNADYQLATWPEYPRRSVLSGMVAVWCAWAMGAKAVVLFGMDGYDGKATALKDARTVAEAVSVPIRTAKESPLSAVFPPYDAKEKFGHYKESPAIKAIAAAVEDGRITVEVVKPVEVCGIRREKGWSGKVLRHQVRAQLKHGMVREV